MCMKDSAIPLLLAAFWLCAAGSHSVAQTQSVPGTAFTTLHSFTGTDGDKSFAALLQANNGSLYGTTYFGGAHNDGEVFQVTTAGNVTTLHSFCSTTGCSDGEYSYAVPVQGADGNFYGTTYLGGSKGDGTVFKMSPSGALKTLHSFAGSDGSQPLAGLAAGTEIFTAPRISAEPTTADRFSKFRPPANSPRCTASVQRLHVRTARIPTQD